MPSYQHIKRGLPPRLAFGDKILEGPTSPDRDIFRNVVHTSIYKYTQVCNNTYNKL